LIIAGKDAVAERVALGAALSPPLPRRVLGRKRSDPPRAPLGELSLGELSLGELSLGELSLGELSLGELDWGESKPALRLQPTLTVRGICGLW